MASVGSVTREAVEELLFLEARLLDERRYEEWNELFTEDGLYWLPVAEEDGTVPDPSTTVSIVYDDAFRRGERVFRTLHTPVLDQNPPSRTIHAVSNVELEPAENGEVLVRCVQQISEIRPGGPGQIGLRDPRTFAARCLYRLREVEGELRIALKQVVLLQSDQPLYNLTFII
jgi:3-phenylpropionate/cinnamic acid dioxygenase small subunit